MSIIPLSDNAVTHTDKDSQNEHLLSQDKIETRYFLFFFFFYFLSVFYLLVLVKTPVLPRGDGGSTSSHCNGIKEGAELGQVVYCVFSLK